MLYKKYHRNFVKQFKIRTRVKFKNYNSFIIGKVSTLPIVNFGVINVVIDSKWIAGLVFGDGTINSGVNAIQKIS